MLDGRDVLPAGLGLGAFMLRLLPAFGSNVVDALLDPDAKLLGLLLPAAGVVEVAFGFAGGGGCAKTVIAAGRTNMPCPIAQSK